MYIVVGVVCLLVVVAVAIALVVYFRMFGCKMDKISLTVRSSDCNIPISDVTITSSDDLTLMDKKTGVYAGEVCGMPAAITLHKEGFEPLTMIVSNVIETAILTCSEPNCTAQTANISVKSTCAMSPVNGVTITGKDIIDTTSSGQGFYKITLCEQPTLVNLEREGYASQTAALSNGSTVTLQCECPGDDWRKFGQSCYYFGQELLSWQDAAIQCGRHGAYLADITSAAENEYVTEEAEKIGGSYWVGGTDIFSEGEWIWTSKMQTMGGLTFWSSGQPDNARSSEHCLQINFGSDKGWNDHKCDYKGKYLCEINV